MIQLSLLDAIAEGERLRDEGLERAVTHADKVVPEWKDKCWSLFLEWLDRMPAGHRFLLEEFRLHCEAQGKIEQPPSNRAFGFLSVKAARAKLIFQCGTGKVNNPNAHRCNAGRWEKA